jgi:uncharacterized protein (TIGR02996 family)
MNIEQQSFIKAIVSNPENNNIRLIYADYLDGTDDETNIKFADFIRKQIKIWEMETELSFDIDIFSSTQNFSLNKAHQFGEWCGEVGLYCKNRYATGITTHITKENLFNDNFGGIYKLAEDYGNLAMRTSIGDMSKDEKKRITDIVNKTKENIKKLEPCLYHRIYKEMYKIYNEQLGINFFKDMCKIHMVNDPDFRIDDIEVKRGFPYKLFLNPKTMFHYLEQFRTIIPIEEIVVLTDTLLTSLYQETNKYIRYPNDYIYADTTQSQYIERLENSFKGIKFTIKTIDEDDEDSEDDEDFEGFQY